MTIAANAETLPAEGTSAATPQIATSVETVRVIGATNFDFIRFVLAALVVFSHSYPIASGNEHNEPLARFTGGQATFGSLAVDCFFIISGYLILHSWTSKPVPLRFMKQRIRRIYPGFVVAAVIGSCCMAPLFTPSVQIADWQFLKQFALGLPHLVAAEPAHAFAGNPLPGVVNGSLWSIAFEFWCYIGILIIGVLKVHRNIRLHVSLFVLLTLLSLAFVATPLNISGGIFGRIFGYPPFWARLLPYFFAGMVCYLNQNDLKYSNKRATAALLALVIASKIPFGLTVVMPVAMAYLLFWLAFKPLGMLSRFAKRGDFSYGIYLYSFPVMQAVASMADGHLTPLTLFTIALPITLVFAFLSWHLVEQRFVRRQADRFAIVSTT